MFKGFHNHDAGTFAKRNAVAVVKRRTPVLVESMERKKTRIRDRGKRIRTASDDHVGLARTNQVASHGNRNGARSAGVAHVGHNAARMNALGHLRSDGGNGHLRDIDGIFAVTMVVFNTEDTTHTASDNDTHALVVRKIRETRIMHSLESGLDAEFGGAVLALCALDLVQRVAMDFGCQVGIAILGVERCRFMDARNRIQGVFPSLFYIVPNGANDTQSRNHTSAIIRSH